LQKDKHTALHKITYNTIILAGRAIQLLDRNFLFIEKCFFIFILHDPMISFENILKHFLGNLKIIIKNPGNFSN